MEDQGKSIEKLQIELTRLRQERAWEKAAERIRSEVLAMRSSNDLPKLIGTISEEMIHLGIAMTSNFIRFVDEGGVRVDRHYYAIPNPRKYGISWTSPQLAEFNKEIAVGEAAMTTPQSDQITLDAWRQRETLSRVVSREDFASRVRMVTDFWGLDEVIPLPERAEWVLVYVKWTPLSRPI